MWGGPSTPGWFHLHCSTLLVRKSPQGDGRRGDARGWEARALRRKASHSRVEDRGCPRCRRPSEPGQKPSCRRDLASPTPEVPGWDLGASGPPGRAERTGTTGPGRRLAGPGAAHGRASLAATARARLSQETAANPGHPARHLPRPGPSVPLLPTPRGSPGSPHPSHAPPARQLPLTPETWRPGPGRRRRRSGARGSQLWARGSGTAGGDGDGDGDRAGGGGGWAAPPVTFSSRPPEEGPGGAAASQVR